MDLSYLLLSALNQGTETGAAPLTTPGVAAQPLPDTGSLAIAPAEPLPIGGSADLYHGPDAPVSASLLAQSGVSAYTRLLNVLANSAQNQQSADQLTNGLGDASTTLKSAYTAVVSQLPAPLQLKDWRFSVSNGGLIFTAGQDELSAQDLAILQKAFADSDVEPAARQVATAIVSIELRQKSGADSGSLAWGKFAVNDTDFADVVDLRAYVTATVPGSKYNPSVPEPVDHSQIPNLFAGMDLRNLVCARPDFLQTNGSVATEIRDALGTPQQMEEIRTLHGQCSCGEVRFTVEDAFDYAFYCHCSRCRLRTGSAFAAIAGIGIDKVQVTVGRERLLIEGECSDGYGARCNRCYAFLFAAVRGRQYMNVSLGVLVDTPGRLPDHHIYVGSKAAWYQINDALPQYDELP